MYLIFILKHSLYDYRDEGLDHQDDREKESPLVAEDMDIILLITIIMILEMIII